MFNVSDYMHLMLSHHVTSEGKNPAVLSSVKMNCPLNVIPISIGMFSVSDYYKYLILSDHVTWEGTRGRGIFQFCQDELWEARISKSMQCILSCWISRKSKLRKSSKFNLIILFLILLLFFVFNTVRHSGVNPIFIKPTFRFGSFQTPTCLVEFNFLKHLKRSVLCGKHFVQFAICLHALLSVKFYEPRDFTDHLTFWIIILCSKEDQILLLSREQWFRVFILLGTESWIYEMHDIACRDISMVLYKLNFSLQYPFD